MMEVVKDGEISVLDGSTNDTVNTVTEPRRDVSGILIKDPSLEPYNIQYNYTGFSVMLGHKKLLGPTDMNSCLSDIMKRQLADANKVMTLKEFVTFNQTRSTEIINAQGTPDNYQEMMKNKREGNQVNG